MYRGVPNGSSIYDVEYSIIQKCKYTYDVLLTFLYMKNNLSK